MSTVRPYLHAFAIVEFNAKDCVASTGFAVLRPKNNNMAEIIYHQLLSNDMDRQFLNMLVGSNYPAINASDVNQLKLWMPLHEKTCIQISKLLAIADQEISLLQKEIMQEKQKKKALMQLLLTGIVRVNI